MATKEQQAQEDLTANMRLAVNNAYGFIKGMENAASFYVVTFEEMMQQQMDRLNGTNVGGKSAKSRIKTVKDDLVSNINAIKNIPQDQIYGDDPKNVVNSKANA